MTKAVVTVMVAAKLSPPNLSQEMVAVAALAEIA